MVEFSKSMFTDFVCLCPSLKNGKGGELNVPSFLVPLPLPAAHPSLKEGGWGDISCPCEFYRKINPCVSDELTVNSSKCVVL